ncbi:MAG: hypothetical protein RLZZ591_1890 [Pseudomonadota bacterium]|jgi:putative ABC transport system permease protein
MLDLLRTYSWQEFRHHPWRNAAAIVAVMLGVALALSVHLINASALDEFSSAVRSVNGEPDLSLHSSTGALDESVYARVAAHPSVTLASPVLEINTYAVRDGQPRLPLRILGIDALVVAGISPELFPRPHGSASGKADRWALFAPEQAFLNPAAMALLAGTPTQAVDTGLKVQSGAGWVSAHIAGTVAASGAALAVMDLGAAQDLFGKIGQLSRIDLKLQAGTQDDTLLADLALGKTVTALSPGDQTERVNQLSSAYRVNLTVLALVALFTGAFLVFSVLSLSVTKRGQQFALLGVLGLTGRERLALVLWESLALGVLGSALGVALGTGLAAFALQVLGGDLGGGYFSGAAPTLQQDPVAALAYAALGVMAALLGGWWPARTAQRLPPAQTLKGLGAQTQAPGIPWVSLALMAAAWGLALLPPIGGLALAAYLAVAVLLLGGITALPALVGLMYDGVAPRLRHRLLPMLAVERARRVRASASVAVSGVVASLSLAVALTVMVASFRHSVNQWLDVVLPADLFVRSARQASASDSAYIAPETVRAVASLPGIARLSTSRIRDIQLAPNRPPVALVARELNPPETNLPLVAGPLPAPPGLVAVYVSEAMVDLYGARLGGPVPALSAAWPSDGQTPNTTFFVAGVWRDYARQFGTVALAREDDVRLTGQQQVSDMALWLEAGADAISLVQAVRDTADHNNPGAGALLEVASASQIRATTLRIFDRSFAVTYWLQAVAMAIGLFGVAASFSAQVLARRKEFGLLAHLGLTRQQVLAVVAVEGLAWTAVGAMAGVALGLAVAVVLVHVVNPQSFHWSMDLMVPWLRLASMCLVLVLTGTLTARLAGAAAASKDSVMSVREDW